MKCLVTSLSLRWLVGIIVFSCSLGKTNQQEDYVCNILSSVANEDEFIDWGYLDSVPKVHIPWIVSLQDNRYDSLTPFCGGVIVDANWVLTTAFCVNGYAADNLKVVAGDSNLTDISGWEQVVGVEEIIVHESYDEFTQKHDVALLRIWPSFTLTWWVAALPLKRNVKSSNYVGVSCKTHGWGMIETSGIISPFLGEANLTVISGMECRHKYPGQIHRTMFCASSDDISFPCSGEWGAPLVCNGTDLVGIASWVNHCGQSDYPVVFVEVKRIIKWVEENVEEYSKKNCAYN